MASHRFRSALVLITLFMLTANVLPNVSAKKACPTTLSLCIFDENDDSAHVPLKRGPQGDQGKIGLTGAEGDVGDIGLKGESGPIGDKGDPGLRGNDGPPGLPGPKSERGSQGDSGPIGPRGPPGKNGFCPSSCIKEATRKSKSKSKKLKYLNSVCKFVRVTDKDGEYHIKNDFMFNPYIKVNCIHRENMTTLTCIPPVSTSPKTFTYTNNTWLSQIGLTLEDIYGLSYGQLRWIQTHSNSGFQTIRFHCLNSNPYPKDNVESSLLLLSWNDKSIGPIATPTKPYFYGVSEEIDGCSIATDDSEWKYTDIKLVTTTVQRVPVIDFFLRDVRPGKTQRVKIEHIQLCFD